MGGGADAELPGCPAAVPRMPCGKGGAKAKTKIKAVATSITARRGLVWPSVGAMNLPWVGDLSHWAVVGSGIDNVLDILAIVFYLLLVLGIGCWVRQSPEGRAGPWTRGWV